MNKITYGLLGMVAATAMLVGSAPSAQAFGEFGICCSQQVEVEITPFNLVTGAYQGRFVDQGIPGFATFDQKVAQGEITAEDLVRAAYMEYRATYEDLVGDTDLIKEVDQYLNGYRLGRN